MRTAVRFYGMANMKFALMRGSREYENTGIR